MPYSMVQDACVGVTCTRTDSTRGPPPEVERHYIGYYIFYRSISGEALGKYSIAIYPATWILVNTMVFIQEFQ